MKSESEDSSMEERIKEVLEKIRPSLQADGGDIAYVGYEKGIVSVSLRGACGSCPMSQMTLKNGVERLLKQEIPEIESVVNV